VRSAKQSRDQCTLGAAVLPSTSLVIGLCSFMEVQRTRPLIFRSAVQLRLLQNTGGMSAIRVCNIQPQR
jgi:hypothetical protein